jgi:hypothetical protein
MRLGQYLLDHCQLAKRTASRRGHWTSLREAAESESQKFLRAGASKRGKVAQAKKK